MFSVSFITLLSWPLIRTAKTFKEAEPFMVTELLFCPNGPIVTYYHYKWLFACFVLWLLPGIVILVLDSSWISTSRKCEVSLKKCRCNCKYECIGLVHRILIRHMGWWVCQDPTGGDCGERMLLWYTGDMYLIW